jgi:hypothetical protein
VTNATVTNMVMRFIGFASFCRAGLRSPTLSSTTKPSMQGYKGWRNFRELLFRNCPKRVVGW